LYWNEHNLSLRLHSSRLIISSKLVYNNLQPQGFYFPVKRLQLTSGLLT
jgi:hypothetical protein